jgi:DNA-directed RNA polymerase I, II, and III subunit RPABC2
MPPAKKQEKKQTKSKKVNFVSNEEEVSNKNIFIKEDTDLTGTDTLELNETELETEKETELDAELEEDEEQDEDDEDHELDDEIEYDDENIEEVDDLYDEDNDNIIKSKKSKIKTKVKKLTSETEDDIKTNDLDDEECEYDYNEIYDEKKEEPSVVVNSEDRITLPKLTKYERVRLIGTRAKQISLGAKVMVKNTNGLSSIEIAKLELSYKMIPMKIKRVLPDNKIEIWKLSELELDN